VALGQESRTVLNAKLDHPVSKEVVEAPDRQHELEASKNISSANQSGRSSGQIGLRSKTLANDKMKPNTERSPGEW
jgi:hypothetical protein